MTDLELDTIPRLLRAQAKHRAQAMAVVDGKKTYNYWELIDSVRVTARGLLSLEIGPGDRVALWAPNSSAWIVCALAVLDIGAVLVPINTRYKGEEAAEVLAKSGAVALITVTSFLDHDYLGSLERAKVPLPALRAKIVVRGDDLPSGCLSVATLNARGYRVDPAESEKIAMAVRPDALSDILYTSGTTGKPKGVTATHAQSLRAYRTWSQTVGLTAEDRYLAALPFFHSFGYKAGWLACLLAGATVFPHPVFDAGAVLGKIAEEKITVLPGPPTLYQSLLAHPELSSFDLSSLRLAVTGAASIPEALIGHMKERLSFKTVLTAYGLTEATGVCTMCQIGDDEPTIAQTSGRAIDGVEVRVAADQGTDERPRGEPGEVLVRGYNVTKGYFEDAEETARVIDEEGWLRTGDIGVMDARGNLRITDRKKDMFIVGGFNVYPAEVEALLARHEGIAMAAVVGAPDERMGEVGVAFVVPRAGVSLTEEEVIAWCKEKIANYKVPRRVIVTDALPLNASGKVEKAVLREKARA